MPSGKIQLLFLWHMHQPYYKDLVTGEYALPWVRLHALKDYYGMVRMLEEFPQIRQTFNLVPSLVAQIQDYVQGTARDPFLEVAAKPAGDLSPQEKAFALRYLFQANETRMIGRYPRYWELWQQYRGQGKDAERAARQLHQQDFADLQVLSQIAWLDELFLADPEIAALVRKGRGYSADDQRVVMERERQFLAKVLPAYQEAARRGAIEISTSPYYHPILPLLCDTDVGRVSSPGLPLPGSRFRHPEDAAEQIRRGLDLHQEVFGVRPLGMWPSEGGVSDEVAALAAQAGLKWLASDEGVLGRSLGFGFQRDSQGRLLGAGAEKLYRFYRCPQPEGAVHMIFRDRALSDLIGFVYSRMLAAEAAQDFIRRIKDSAQPLVDTGKNAVVAVILDGENAWEHYPESGRDFLRYLYDGIQRSPQIEALTVSQGLAGQAAEAVSPLRKLAPGSWINANFNVWIGAAEDNRAWDGLSAARNFCAQASAGAAEAQRKQALEELLIAEGSDWNWWYGPEHHSANDREFDELYRKHLANVYRALGASPPDALAQPICGEGLRPYFVPQTAYIHPRIDGDTVGYFDWVGAAVYTADRRGSAMHGKQFFLSSAYAGIDESWLYGRLDFLPATWSASEHEAGGNRLDLAVDIESLPPKSEAARRLRLDVHIEDHALQGWKLSRQRAAKEIALRDEPHQEDELENAGLVVRMLKVFEFQMSLSALEAQLGGKLRLRFNLWRNRLPADALPQEGWIELSLLSEQEMNALLY